MAQNPKVVAALSNATDSQGTGVGGTRNILGTSTSIMVLEAELAACMAKNVLTFSPQCLFRQCGKH